MQGLFEAHASVEVRTPVFKFRRGLVSEPSRQSILVRFRVRVWPTAAFRTCEMNCKGAGLSVRPIFRLQHPFALVLPEEIGHLAAMMKEDCLFCQFASGNAECHEVFRNDRVVAFLDNAPIRTGHVQIIPTAHYEYFDMLPWDLASEIIGLGQRFAAIQKRLFEVHRVAFLFTGGDVPHAHAHLVPMVDKHDITSCAYIQEARAVLCLIESEDSL